jgi:hypothetical protein
MYACTCVNAVAMSEMINRRMSEYMQRRDEPLA